MFKNLLKNITEYKTEYNLISKKYKKPKVYNAKGDITKRWYVYYDFVNPITGKFERQNPIYAKVNRIKDVKERTKAINEIRNIVEKVLEDGFSPYEEEKNDFSETIIPKTVAESIEFALNYWKNTTSESTLRDYKSRLRLFEKWLIENGLRGKTINDIRKKIITTHLNEVLQKISPKNRNNQRAALSSFFALLEKNEYVATNPVNNIEIIKAKPKRNKTYSSTQEDEVFTYMQQHDPQLLLFVKFVSYNFLRPIEVARLQVKDINFNDKLLTIKTKTEVQKTKIIPEILLQELSFLKQYKPDDYLFSPTGVGVWEATETNRRNYWSKRFKKVKDVFKLGEDYGIYSFRHTFITKLYREMRKELTPFEVKSRLMLITGHTTMTALEKYLRDIDAELPEDYSHLIKKL